MGTGELFFSKEVEPEGSGESQVSSNDSELGLFGRPTKEWS
ncbi:hypothetical protein JMJ77_0013794, partial [Colletotrichum scovillei]